MRALDSLTHYEEFAWNRACPFCALTSVFPLPLPPDAARTWTPSCSSTRKPQSRTRAEQTSMSRMYVHALRAWIAQSGVLSLSSPLARDFFCFLSAVAEAAEMRPSIASASPTTIARATAILEAAIVRAATLSLLFAHDECGACPKRLNQPLCGCVPTPRRSTSAGTRKAGTTTMMRGRGAPTAGLGGRLAAQLRPPWPAHRGGRWRSGWQGQPSPHRPRRNSSSSSQQLALH